MNKTKNFCNILMDNGSIDPNTVIGLRKVASLLGKRVGEDIFPVSLLHSSKILAEEISGKKAWTLESFIEEKIKENITSFFIIPLFFGESKSITSFLPTRLRYLASKHKNIDVRIAPTVIDLEARSNEDMLEILFDLAEECRWKNNLLKPSILLIDHGSPSEEVNEVRRFLIKQIKNKSTDSFSYFADCAMESREGEKYSFNKPLLEDILGSKHFEEEVIILKLFFFSGRHAGNGGDIDQIRWNSEKKVKNLKTFATSVISSHPKLIDILEKRFRGKSRYIVRKGLENS